MSCTRQVKKEEAEALSVSDPCKAGLGWRIVSGAQSSKVTCWSDRTALGVEGAEWGETCTACSRR